MANAWACCAEPVQGASLSAMIDPRLSALLLERIVARRVPGRMLVVGLCGAQGAGKSTLSAHLAAELAAQGRRVAVLSLDDLYLSRAERLQLAAAVHPLFATRGVPGTHDVALGLATLAALDRGEAAPLPRFDKAADERCAPADWPCAPPGTEVLLFEGWCLGARPQPDVTAPVNALEASEDPQGRWRGHANAMLGGTYQHLFARLDLLVLLAAPGWEVVGRWREQQEAALRQHGGAAVMDPAQVQRFIQHYERLTRWILVEMPERADLVVRLGPEREGLVL